VNTFGFEKKGLIKKTPRNRREAPAPEVFFYYSRHGIHFFLILAKFPKLLLQGL